MSEAGGERFVSLLPVKRVVSNAALEVSVSFWRVLHVCGNEPDRKAGNGLFAGLVLVHWLGQQAGVLDISILMSGATRPLRNSQAAVSDTLTQIG
jgi:hypothetical protein